MENIMLQDEKKQWIKIIDFGLSNKYNEENLLKTLCGSPEYAAPELFVKGKTYGPEVDLWSLGVIMYVMGTGRLPFMSPRDESTSADERRRRLMLQINRGLSASHERLIVTLSDDYKNLLRLALTPIAHKRIRLGELRRHPWIDDRASSPSTNSNNAEKLQLCPAEHEAIVREISVLMDVDCREAEMDIINRRYGNIGGIYNILAHKMQLRKLRRSTLEMKFLETYEAQIYERNFDKSSLKSPKNIKIGKNISTAKRAYSSNKLAKETTQTAYVQNKIFKKEPRRTIREPARNFEKAKKKGLKSEIQPEAQHNKILIHTTKDHSLEKQRKATMDPSNKYVKICQVQTNNKHKANHSADVMQRDARCIKTDSTFRLGKNTTAKKLRTSEPGSVIPKIHDKVKRLLTKVNVSKVK